ncbi:hypothetical protein Kpho02_76130 [Kitasatospora phosalacinea]|uniref:Uncharacterized protein n=1 Tax=Kitasatospora phosalacinea TaxID=2065 RepID=A0A9W6V524_9ACTN|nr:hypothetical protein Kpho02_76130 [Kitasatospora phosalacinea]
MLGAALLAPLVLGVWTAEPGTTRGGEVRDGLRLSVSTNTSPDPAVRLRAGEAATRTYHLSNRTEYPLGNVVLSDPQLPGGQLSCGADRSVPPGGAIDCTATLTVAPGPQSTRVSAVADAPNHLPQAHADATTGYLGITAGIRLTRLGAPTGTGLSHRSTPRTPPSTTFDPTAAPGAARPERTPVRAAGRAVAVGTGSIELQYRLEAFGDVPITAASITEGLPGLGEVNCTGPDGGHTIAPGQAVDCRATGTARPGRQTGTARAEGTADDATVGPDGSRQAPRRVSAEADGTYDGLQPTPPSAGPTEPTTAGSGSDSGSAPGTGTGSGAGAGAGQGTGSTGTGAGQPAPGTAGTGGTGSAGTAGGAGTPPGSSTDAVPPGLLPITVPPGTRPVAAAPGQPPANAGQVQGQGQGQGQGQQPAAGAPALAGQLLGPFLPGQAPALLPGGTAFARPASPFAAPGQFAASTPFTSSSVAPATANPSAPAQAPSPAAGQQSRPAADRSPGAQAQSQYATGDWPAEEEDRPWDTTEVMMLLLALILPVLCVLAAMFTVRNRSRR